jgi:catechol 2,3-dioxygenase-like lactoylglutathione lyase family enzyme
MIGYVTIGTNDIARAEKFYDALLAEMGGKRVMTNERMRFYGAGRASR